MKVDNIMDQLELEDQFDIETQGCLDDCEEFFQKTNGDWAVITRTGEFKANGKESIAEIRRIKNIFGVYCYRKFTAKTTALW